MKRVLLVIVVLLCAVSLFAEGSKEQGGAASKTQQIVLRLAETHPAGYPTTEGDMEFARLVEERTNGRIRVEVYPSSQLGEERAAIEQVQFGAIDFTRVSVSPLASFSRNFDALQMPYLYRDADHMWKVLNGEIGQEFLDSLAPANFVGLTFYDGGSRNFYNSRREVRSVADLRGLKIRVQESELMLGLVRSLGATPTPMAFGEVYSALQTGVIDGAENNWSSYLSTSHYEVAKYFIVDQHTRVPEILIASKIVMDRLSPEDQAIIKQAAKDSTPFQIELWNKAEAEAEAAVIAGGAQIYRPTPAQIQEFMNAVQPMYERLTPQLQEVVRRIRAVR